MLTFAAMQIYLFSYGTLQLKQVQLSSFGRELVGSKDRLPAYRLEEVRITDPDVLAASEQVWHPIAVYTGNEADGINGTVFELTQLELDQADRYEVSDYQRVSVQLTSGKTAWVYVQRNTNSP